MKTPRSPDLALLMPGLICSALTVAFILFSMPGFDDVFREGLQNPLVFPDGALAEHDG
jgi:hypothetical protein